MKKIGVLTCLALCAATFSTQAQTEKPSTLQFGGLMLNRDVMMAGDLANLSQPHVFGTARVMGMGGAFASLGADISSMSLNPAGLGMYRRSEVAITPMVSMSGSNTPGTQSWTGSGKTHFSVPNVGAAFNVFESPSRKLTSVTLGVGMNRIADFNSRYSFSSESRYNPARPDEFMPTIAEVFGQQLGQTGIFPDSKGNLGYGSYDPAFWPAILGYNTYMMSANDGMWGIDCIGQNASVLHSVEQINSGAINEFTLSAGANFDNIFYIGATLGIQSVYRKQELIYQEEYGYFNSDGYAMSNGERLPQQLDYANIWQRSIEDGTGVNFKLGMIVRPMAGLRIGLAIHTPTFYSLSRTYTADAQSLLLSNTSSDEQFNQDATDQWRDDGENRWEFTAPTRFMLGASYTFGNVAIVSFDYERDWYNGIRVSNLPSGLDLSAEGYKAEFKANFRATNALRAGLEIRPLPNFALRAGGGYTSSMLKDASIYYTAPVAMESYYFSAGVGVNLSRSISLDVSYQNLSQKQSQYQLFFSQFVDGPYAGEFMTESGLYNTTLKRHFITMTLAMRF